MAGLAEMMGLHHFAHQAEDGVWHVCYRQPRSGHLVSLMDAVTQKPCEQEAERLNKLQAKSLLASFAAAIHPADRKIPAGFYTDTDSQ